MNYPALIWTLAMVVFAVFVAYRLGVIVWLATVFAPVITLLVIGVAVVFFLIAVFGSPAKAQCQKLTPGDVIMPLRALGRLKTYKLIETRTHLASLDSLLYADEDPAWLPRYDTGLFVSLNDGTGFVYRGHDGVLCRADPVPANLIVEVGAVLAKAVVASVPEIMPRSVRPRPRFRKPTRYRIRVARHVKLAPAQTERPSRVMQTMQ